MSKIRWAQIGTKHGHASGKFRALQTNPNVELVGVFEPDSARRQEVAGQEAYKDARWLDDISEIHGDKSIVAVASEGSNIESLDQTAGLIEAGKHVWYDKPAGCDWPQWQKVVAEAEKKNLLIQMGYMFRYHAGFNQVGEWVKSGFLGDITSVRGHMSTSLPVDRAEALGVFKAGIFFDLSGHMLDQVCWLLGRPHTITSFLRNDSDARNVVDNSVTVYEYDKAIAYLDISSMETRPAARRFEVYGTKGSAIILEPFEPGDRIRLCLDKARDGHLAGEQIVEVTGHSRQALYELALQSFMSTIAGARQRDRSSDHELLVQETILRATGDL